MPGFGSSLSEEQIAAVSAFERVRFGGQEPEAALSDCGLAEDPEEGAGQEGAGEDGTDVEQPPETTDTDGTTGTDGDVTDEDGGGETGSDG